MLFFRPQCVMQQNAEKKKIIKKSIFFIFSKIIRVDDVVVVRIYLGATVSLRSERRSRSCSGTAAICAANVSTRVATLCIPKTQFQTQIRVLIE
jgi:hypothetical protein